MEPYEKAVIEIKAITDLIMLNFLHKPHEETFYYFQKPDESKHIPPLKNQIGILEKLKRDDGISNLKLFKDYATFKLNLEKFNIFQKHFTNPVLSFIKYKPNNISPLHLPEKTKWEHIIIKFINGNDVRITLRNKETFQQDATYKEMGFENRKEHNPDVQWKLLRILSENEDILSWKNTKASDKMKKRKQILSQKLREYFQLDEDPFEVYRREKAYKLKLTILPE